MRDLRIAFDELFDALLILRSALFEVTDRQREVRELSK